MEALAYTHAYAAYENSRLMKQQLKTRNNQKQSLVLFDPLLATLFVGAMAIVDNTPTAMKESKNAVTAMRQ